MCLEFSARNSLRLYTTHLNDTTLHSSWMQSILLCLDSKNKTKKTEEQNPLHTLLGAGVYAQGKRKAELATRPQWWPVPRRHFTLQYSTANRGGPRPSCIHWARPECVLKKDRASACIKHAHHTVQGLIWIQEDSVVKKNKIKYDTTVWH